VFPNPNPGADEGSELSCPEPLDQKSPLPFVESDCGGVEDRAAELEIDGTAVIGGGEGLGMAKLSADDGLL